MAIFQRIKTWSFIRYHAIRTSLLVHVKPSTIHGKGLFARTHIGRGTYIGEYRGVTVSKDGRYVLWRLNEKGRIIGIDGTNVLRYANHSPNPNTAIYHGVHMYAINDIEPGEEITWHYGEDWKNRTPLA